MNYWTGVNLIFNSTLIAGVVIVNFALIFYSVAFINVQRRPFTTGFFLSFLMAGLFCDSLSTVFMIAGSRNIPFTAHGILGYTALAAMLIDTALHWRHRLKNGPTLKINGPLVIYNRLAFGWWVIAYVAGAIMSLGLRG